MEHLWFVQYILICYLLLPYVSFLLRAIDDVHQMYGIVVVVGLLAALQFIGFTFNGYDMNPNRVTCFVFGAILASLKEKKRILKWMTKIICMVAIVLNAIKIYGVYIVQIKNNLIFDLFVKYVHGLLGIAIFLLFYWLFENTKSNVILKISDRYSYYIYLGHQIFILGPLSLMKLTSNTVINIVIICGCILTVGILLEKGVLLINALINTVNKNIKATINRKLGT